MIDDTNYNPEVFEAPEESIQQTEQHIAASEAKKQEESYQAYNFRMMRERQRELEEENYRIRREAEELRKIQQQVPQEEDLGVEDDDYLTGKVAKNQYKKLSQQYSDLQNKLNQVLEQSSKQREVQEDLALKAKYKDYDNVVTQESLAFLEKNKPYTYKQIVSAGSLFDAGSIAYEALRDTKNYSEENRRIQENSLKPRSAASANASRQSPLSEYKSSGPLTTSQKADIMAKSREYQKKSR